MKENNFLVHHGIKGQKWGVRRYQNEDGTRTEAGLKRYSVDTHSAESKQFRKDAGAGVLLKRNKTAEAIKYQQADAAGKRDAFKESKAAFKANKTTGQKVANKLINGPLGSRIYDNLRAQGHSTGVALGATTASRLLLPPFGAIAAYYFTNNGYGIHEAADTAKKVGKKTKETAKYRLIGE